MLEGCSRSRELRADNRRPITFSVLSAIVPATRHVCYNTYEAKLFSAIFTLAYFGLFRISELVSPTNYGVYNQIRQGDLFLSADGNYVFVRLRRYKTHQNGPPTTLKIPKETREPCPLRAVQSYLSIATKGEVAFCHYNGKPVTRQQVTSVLHRCLLYSKQEINGFKSHSFRIGRATDLANYGLPHETIMRLGRWSSETFKRYIRN